MNDKFALPTVLVLFGATGDLVRRKIVPALFYLYIHGRLPKLMQIIGYARRPLSDDDFRSSIRDILLKNDLASNPKAVEDFLSHFSYQQGNFDKLTDYKQLAARLGRTDESWRVCANKLYYLAVPPQFYKGLFTNLSKSGLTTPCSDDEGWTRIIVEKPFGQNAETARELDVLLGTLFKEEQIYRIDHYLAKDMLQNILMFRFSNNLLEQNWSNRSIERIDIRLWETLGVEDRGTFYDGVGALRDVGQNHLLQMLALVTMDHPENYTADSIRRKRAEILENLVDLPVERAGELSLRAQYDGYQTIAGVAPKSTTETYFRIQTELVTPRWQGVPITLEAGKRMGEVRKEVVVTFRHATPCLCPPGKHYRNWVKFQLEPREAITIEFWSKQPGFELKLEPRELDFLLKEHRGRRQYVEEYSKLLLDCILGDQTLFISTDEVLAMWRAIDPVLAAWKKKSTPLTHYEPDTNQAVLAADTHFEREGVPHIRRQPIGMVGLGKMGGNLVRQLLEKGWQVTGFDPNPKIQDELALEGMVQSLNPINLVEKLTAPRIVWLMVPAGKAVDELLREITPKLTRGDIVIDGGNSQYTDSARRAASLKRRGIEFVDIGVSGGPYGARTGAVLLVGGKRETYERLQPLLRDLATPGGVEYCGDAGAGHFVKMIHNGIEYGMMQAIAEGFAVMDKSTYKLDLTNIAEVYNHGSVIESRLVGWLADAFRIHGEKLTGVSGTVAHTGEGQWTVDAAKKLKVDVKIIEGALEFRKKSAANPDYTGQVLSALRGQFGGHATTTETKPTKKGRK